MVTVMHACLGSWKCGKGCAFTIPTILFLFFERKFPEKFTMKGGGKALNAQNPSLRPV